MSSAADIIDKIVLLEWDMFQAVNEGGPRALCQEDRLTFEGMRRAQFLAWSLDACSSYLNDLENAVKEGRNLINEKYIHMMKYSSPELHGKLKAMIPAPSESAAALAKDISDKMLLETKALFGEYPYVAGSGRPLNSEEDASGVTSIETYQLGELLSYSEKTLKHLLEHLLDLERAGQALAKIILENTVSFYGYETLESAEAETKKRIETEISCGCPGCGDSDCGNGSCSSCR